MPTCKEVARSIAADELTAADWRRKLSIKIHLLMCRHCRRYARQMRAIGDAARQIFGDPSTDANSSERLRSSILGQIANSEESDPNPPM